MNRRKLYLKAPPFSFLCRWSHVQKDTELCISAQNLENETAILVFKASFKITWPPICNL